MADRRENPDPSSLTSPSPLLARTVAHTLLEGFDRHYRLFRELSRNARDRFARSDWKAVRAAVRARIDMYDARVRETVQALEPELEGHDEAALEALFREVKLAYIGLLYEHKQPECAETFYNSVATRLLHRTYHQNACIFSRPAISTEHIDGEEPTYRCYYPRSVDLESTLRRMLVDTEVVGPSGRYEDLERDVGHLMRVIAEHFPRGWEHDENFQLQVLRSLFFRGQRAYMVGRALKGNVVVPFVVPLRKSERGDVFVDTILLDTKAVGRLFSLARDYFMVDMEVPSAYVAFLESVVPSRSRSELYTLVGLQKQGKTLLFRDLVWHLKHSTDRFVAAPGTRGMVMVVFSLPSFPYVFKVIRDWFQPPKDADHALVRERYDLVKHHDRAGRMADSLEYEDVVFPKERFHPDLIEDFRKLAPESIRIEGESVTVKHLYIERRLIPLDMYVESAGTDEARLRACVGEYGDAIKDLAKANIFPGDLMLKNFGVTRFGRVLFYDYDEIQYLTDCRFRTMPKPRFDEDEMASEPWYSVEPNDVFPEQFPTFLLPPGAPRELFLELHRDLAEAPFWTRTQEKLRAGEPEEAPPYPEQVRFENRFGPGKGRTS